MHTAIQEKNRVRSRCAPAKATTHLYKTMGSASAHTQLLEAAVLLSISGYQDSVNPAIRSECAMAYSLTNTIYGPKPQLQ